MPYELRGISADKQPEDLHPLYVELTAAVSYLENALKEHDDLLFVKEQYEYEAQLGRTTGKKTAADTDDFLAEFPAEEARMRAEVARLEGEVRRLRRLCELRRVMRKHMSVRMAYALDPHTKVDDMELEDRAAILARWPTLAHAVFPELLSQPPHVLAAQTALQALRAAAHGQGVRHRRAARRRRGRRPRRAGEPLACRTPQMPKHPHPNMPFDLHLGDGFLELLVMARRPLSALVLLRRAFLSYLSCLWRCSLGLDANRRRSVLRRADSAQRMRAVWGCVRPDWRLL